MNKEKENIYLLKLLEDPDTQIYNILKERILSDYTYFKPFLENYQIISESELAINRSESILDEINYLEFETRLLNYASQGNHKLQQGAFLLETFFDKDLSVEEIETAFEEIFKEIWIELNYTQTNIEKVKIINKVLFKKIGFKRIKRQNIKPKDLNIYNCIKTKTYIAPTIALLYCIIAEKLNIPVYMLNIPGIFITGYFDEEIAKIIGSENEVALYIHPYDDGAILGAELIKSYFKENNYDISIYEVSNLTNIEFLLFFFNLRVNIIKKIKPDLLNFEQARQIDNILKKIK